MTLMSLRFSNSIQSFKILKIKKKFSFLSGQYCCVLIISKFQPQLITYIQTVIPPGSCVVVKFGRFSIPDTPGWLTGARNFLTSANTPRLATRSCLFISFDFSRAKSHCVHLGPFAEALWRFSNAFAGVQIFSIDCLFGRNNQGYWGKIFYLRVQFACKAYAI